MLVSGEREKSPVLVLGLSTCGNLKNGRTTPVVDARGDPGEGGGE